MKENSRKERRKENRKDNKKKKFDSWFEHQQSRKQKKFMPHSDENNPKKAPFVSSQYRKDNKISQNDLVLGRHNTSEPPTANNSRLKLGSSRSIESSGNNVGGRSKGDKNPRSKFEEYLEMDTQQGVVSGEEDLELERKLAKKLKVKNGKLGGVDDDINLLIEGTKSEIDFKEVCPVLEEVQEKRSNASSSSKKCKSKLPEKDAEVAGGKIENRKKTKFEKYLEMEMQGGVPSAEADIYMERKLAKKLKVKDGKLDDDDDGFNELVEGIPSVLDFSDYEEEIDDTVLKKCSSKKTRKIKTTEQEGKDEMASGTVSQVSAPVETSTPDVVPEKGPSKASKSEKSAKYVAPHLRSCARNESEECVQIRRRIRGLLNRLSESNVESITGEMTTIFRSVARITSSQIIIEEVLGSCSGGPRGNEQYAAVFAAFVAGMAASVGIDFGAKLLESLAKCFEEESLKEDNLSLRNLTLLLSYLYIFGVCSSDLIYDFMIVLSKRLMETDVSTILAVLQCCGMNLRSDDPVTMKNFVLTVQNRANDLKASSESGQSNANSKRMEFMLETICEIKNNKKRAKEDTPQHTRIKKWLQQLKSDDILVRGLTWSKLLDPAKKGQWWLSGDLVYSTSHVKEVASTIDMESLEAQKLLQLASTQRMNTDIRRAIFCIIMSGEDYVDAFEKLLRLDLQGKQDREIMRVLLECCLQEKVFNKYYSVLAIKFCKRDNNYATTLKYCLWDQFKELDSTELMRSRNLAKFVVEMIASFSLSLSALKKIDFNDATQMTGKVIIHFRMLFETLFERPDSVVWNVFTRIAAELDLESLRNGIEFFIKNYVVSSDNTLAKKFKIAKKALGNVEGVLM